MYSYYNGLAVLFAGLLIVDVANVILTLTVSVVDDAPAAAPAKEAAESPAKAEENAV